MLGIPTIYLIVAAAAAVVVVIVAVLIARASKRRKLDGADADELQEQRDRERDDAVCDGAEFDDVGGVDEATLEDAATGDTAASADESVGELLGASVLSGTEIEAMLEEPEEFFEVAAAARHEARYSSIDVRASCGFDFSSVVEGHLTRVESEKAGSSHVVYASGANFAKIEDDLRALQPMLDILSSASGEAMYGVAFPECTHMLAMLRPFGEKQGRSRGMQGIVTLTVRECDDEGCALKYPVMMKAASASRKVVDAEAGTAAVRAQLDSLVLDMAYLPNGRADIGRIIRWEGRRGYSCEFRWSRSVQEYVPLKVQVASTPGNWHPASR